MTEEKNGNGKAIWITIGSVAVFVMVMIGLFAFSITPLTEKVEKLENKVEELERVADSNKSRITLLESEVKFYREDTDEDNDKIIVRLEKLENQQVIVIGNSNKLLELLSRKEKEKLNE